MFLISFVNVPAIENRSIDSMKNEIRTMRFGLISTMVSNFWYCVVIGQTALLKTAVSQVYSSIQQFHQLGGGSRKIVNFRPAWAIYGGRAYLWLCRETLPKIFNLNQLKTVSKFWVVKSHFYEWCKYVSGMQLNL